MIEEAGRIVQNVTIKLAEGDDHLERVTERMVDGDQNR